MMSMVGQNLHAAEERISTSNIRATLATNGSKTVGMKVLMLVPQKLADDREEAVRQGERPQADYDAVAAALREAPRGKGDILDLSSVERDGGWVIRLVRLLFGPYWALAALGHLRCKEYDAVFSHSEIVGLPFALIAALKGRPRHVMTAYYLNGRRNALWYRVLLIHRQIDKIFTQSREQYETGRKALYLSDDKLIHVEQCGYIDSKFFAGTPAVTVDERQICSAGREHRDYGTLIKAMADLPDFKLKVDPASPWSLQADGLANLKLPPNVEVCRMKLGTVRRLYAESAVVVVPLHSNAIGAGTTTLVEAMSMGKPVIITRSKDGSFARRSDLVDGQNVILVGEYNVAALRDAIERLMGDANLRARIGASGRRWAERHAGRDPWLEIVLPALSGKRPTPPSL
jgi:glycosyltransferase involved in cell wall biosynthesis